jgi:nicotinamide mononucleotide transporter
LTLQEIVQQFISDIKITTRYEYVAVFAGIISVWYSRKENVLVFPTGLVNTIIYVYLSFKGKLFGEATVNFYYTIMSIVGWYMWTKKNEQQQTAILQITKATKKEWGHHLLFFTFFYAIIYFSLTYYSDTFTKGAIPWADAFASATAFTGMWLMTKKKLESWYWWIATNIASIPLYFVKHYVFTSVYYVVLLIMAVWGLVEWVKIIKKRTL